MRTIIIYEKGDVVRIQSGSEPSNTDYLAVIVAKWAHGLASLSLTRHEGYSVKFLSGGALTFDVKAEWVKEAAVVMNKQETLAAIKTLRDKINDHPMPADGSGDWVNEVVSHLDAASDVIEFPKGTGE